MGAPVNTNNLSPSRRTAGTRARAAPEERDSVGMAMPLSQDEVVSAAAEEFRRSLERIQHWWDKFLAAASRRQMLEPGPLCHITCSAVLQLLCRCEAEAFGLLDVAAALGNRTVASFALDQVVACCLGGPLCPAVAASVAALLISRASFVVTAASPNSEGATRAEEGVQPLWRQRLILSEYIHRHPCVTALLELRSVLADVARVISQLQCLCAALARSLLKAVAASSTGASETFEPRASSGAAASLALRLRQLQRLLHLYVFFAVNHTGGSSSPTANSPDMDVIRGGEAAHGLSLAGSLLQLAHGAVELLSSHDLRWGALSKELDAPVSPAGAEVVREALFLIDALFVPQEVVLLGEVAALLEAFPEMVPAAAPGTAASFPCDPRLRMLALLCRAAAREKTAEIDQSITVTPGAGSAQTNFEAKLWQLWHARPAIKLDCGGLEEQLDRQQLLQCPRGRVTSAVAGLCMPEASAAVAGTGKRERSGALKAASPENPLSGPLCSVFSGGVGLWNCGNSCFANSVFQLLFRCRSFRNDFVRLALSPAVFRALAPLIGNSINNHRSRSATSSTTTSTTTSSSTTSSSSSSTSSCPALQAAKVRFALGLLLGEMMWRAQHSTTTVHSCVDPEIMISALPPPFNERRQQDASEFSKVVLALCDMEVETREASAGPPESDAPEEVSGASTDARDVGDFSRVVGKHMGGEWAQCVRCHRCGSVAQRRERFWDLSLPLPAAVGSAAGKTTEAAGAGRGGGEGRRGGGGGGGGGDPQGSGANVLSLQALVDEIFGEGREELMHGADRYQCDICQQKTEASRWVSLVAQRMPEYLTLQLNRFFYDQESQGFGKLMSGVTIPSVLRVPVAAEERFDADAQLETSPREVVEYALAAFIVHSGSSPASGHYYTYATQRHNPGPGDVGSREAPKSAAAGYPDGWIKLNDSIVTVISAEELAVAAAASPEAVAGSGAASSAPVASAATAAATALHAMLTNGSWNTETPYVILYEKQALAVAADEGCRPEASDMNSSIPDAVKTWFESRRAQAERAGSTRDRREMRGSVVGSIAASGEAAVAPIDFVNYNDQPGWSDDDDDDGGGLGRGPSAGGFGSDGSKWVS